MPLRAPIAVGRSPWHIVLWIVWGACMGLGLIGIWQRITGGHLPAGYGSYVPWGLWIAIYFHGVGIAGGAFAIAALGYLLNWPGFRHLAAFRAAVVLAFATIVPALLAVWFDLGHMERAYRIMLDPSFTSMMAFNAWMYNAFLVVAAVTWFVSYKYGTQGARGLGGWLKPLMCLGILFAVMFPSQSGAFFGVVDAKPYWHSPIMPVMFLASAITAGGAMLLLIRGIIGCGSPAGLGDTDPAVYTNALSRLRKIVIGGLLAYFVLEFAEFSIAIWNPASHSPAIELVLWGPYWWVFWIVHLGLGGVLPFALLLSKSRSAWIAAGLFVAVTFISARLNVLIPGQAVGEIQGLQEAFHHPRLDYTYHATAMEYLVGLFLIAVGMTVYYIGRRISKYMAARAARLEGAA